MAGLSPTAITQLLHDWGEGDQQSLERLIPVVYRELHRLADHYLRQERPDHTLEPTALVHEAYLRLADWHGVHWQNRTHFFGIAAQLMRRILVDSARRHRAAKRGSGGPKITLSRALERADIESDYRGSELSAGTRSVAFRLTFRAPDRTLRDTEVDEVEARLLAALSGELGIRRRDAGNRGGG